jgi:antitoxin CptB
MASPPHSAAELNQLRWRCRRGMRELDVLLERYLTVRWAEAVEAERTEFRALLELSDPELASLCLGRSIADGARGALVARLQSLRSELFSKGAVSSSDHGRTPRPERTP